MRISDLQFVPPDLVERSVSWSGPDGDYEGTIQVRRLSYGAMELLGREAEKGKSFGAQLISECVVFEGGETMSYDMAFQLPKPIGKALFDAVVSVNTGLKPEKN